MTTLKSLLKSNSTIDIKTFNFSDKEALKKLITVKDQDRTEMFSQLMGYQRLLRLTDSEKTSLALFEKGLHSVFQITTMARSEFVKTYAAFCLPKKGRSAGQQAALIYDKALSRKTQVVNTYIGIQQHNSAHYKASRIDNLSAVTAANFNNVPSYEEQFGGLDFCTCPDCRSIFSPAAYFVDLMQMQTKYITDKKNAEDKTKLALKARRPDLWEKELSCKNTNTLIPTISIVNDVLAQSVGEKGKGYQNLDEATYPFNLPYSLPLTETNFYLQQQNTNLAALWTMLSPADQTAGDLIQQSNIQLATLGLSAAQWNLYTTAIANEDVLAGYYGINLLPKPAKIKLSLITILTSVEVFLHQAGLTYIQLRELLYQGLSEEQFDENKYGIARTFYINTSDPATQSITDPVMIAADGLTLVNLSIERLDRLNRFIRLAQALQLSFADLNQALITAGRLTGKPYAVDKSLPFLAWTKSMQKAYPKMSINEICALQGLLKNYGSDGKPGLLDEVFFNENVPYCDLLKTEVAAGRKWLVPQFDPAEVSLTDALKIQAALVAALKISVNELLFLANIISGKPGINVQQELLLTVENLSALFRCSKLSQLYGLSLTELFAALGLPGAPADAAGIMAKPVSGSDSDKGKLQAVFSWLDVYVQSVKQYTVSTYQLEYLLTGSSSQPQIQNQVLGDQALTNFYNGFQQSISDSLTQETSDRGLTLHILFIQQVSALYDLAADVFAPIIQYVPVFPAGLPEKSGDAQQTEFRSLTLNDLLAPADGLPPADLEKIKTALQNLQVYAVLIKVLGLSAADTFSITHTPQCYGISKDAMGSVPFFLRLENILAIIKFKGMELALEDTQNHLLNYLEAVPHKDEAAEAASLFHKLTQWNTKQVEFLFKKLWNTDAKKTAAWDTIEGLCLVMQWFLTSEELGLDVSSLWQLYELSKQQYSKAGQTETKLKEEQKKNYARYEQAAADLWGGLSIRYEGKPTELLAVKTAVRIQTRNALAPYVLHHLNVEGVSNYRDLSNYLLIDVEVGPEVETSLIGSAISTVQLYVHRCLNNLEKGVNVLDELEQWWEWMGNYRVWEANRRVFLFPENYIEPELRKNKTPLFTQLEMDLQSANLKNPADVEAALYTYMDGFAEVADLEVVGCAGYDYTMEVNTGGVTEGKGIFTEECTKTFCIVGRTSQEPHQYFYRLAVFMKALDGEQYLPVKWEPWLKINQPLQPIGPVKPVFAFGKWFITWVEQEQTGVKKVKDKDEEVPVYTALCRLSFLNFNKEWVSPQTPGRVELPKTMEEIDAEIMKLSLDKAKNSKEIGIKETEKKSWNQVYPSYMNSIELLVVTYGIKIKDTKADGPYAFEYGTSGLTKNLVFASRFAAPEQLYANELLNPKVKVNDSFEYQYWMEFSKRPILKDTGAVFWGLPKDAPNWNHYCLDEVVHIVQEQNSACNWEIDWDKFATHPVKSINFIEHENKIHVAVKLSIRGHFYTGTVEDNNKIKITKQHDLTTVLYLDTTDDSLIGMVVFKKNICYYYLVEKTASALNNSVAFNGRIIQNGTELKTHTLPGIAVADDKLFISWIADKRVPKMGELDMTTVKDRTTIKNEELVMCAPATFSALTSSCINSVWQLHLLTYPEVQDKARTTKERTLEFGAYIQNSNKFILKNSANVVVNAGTSFTVTDVGLCFFNSELIFNLNIALSGGGSTISKRILTVFHINATSLQPMWEGTLEPIYRCNEEGRIVLIYPFTFNNTPFLGGSYNIGDKEMKGRVEVQEASYYRLSVNGLPPAFTFENPDLIAVQEFTMFSGKEINVDTNKELYTNSKPYITRAYQDVVFKKDGKINNPDAYFDPEIKSSAVVINEPGWQLYNKEGIQLLSGLQKGKSEIPVLCCYRLNTTAFETLAQTLYMQCIPGLLSIASQQTPEIPFELLHPNGNTTLPSNTIDLEGGAMSQYYWELFFYMPFLIAKSLQDQQEPGAAQKWYDYIFNPTVNEVNWDLQGDDAANDKYWRFIGLRSGYNATLKQELDESWAKEVQKDTGNAAQLYAYHNDPFDPHAIALLRPIAYQKTMVMHYIANLISGGDKLFRQYTVEAIVEAAMLYMMAYDLLGNEPLNLGACVLPQDKDLEKLLADKKSDSNEFLLFLAQATKAQENVIAVRDTPNNYIPGIYFGLPENDMFLAYWDTVKERLYSIRHGLNIDGQRQKLALFQPAIDPKKLVEQIANGGSIAGALANMQAAVPYYRFSVMIQLAKNTTQTVMQFGQSLLSALEKKDAEQLSLMYNQNQLTLLQQTTGSKQAQVDSLSETLESLKYSLQSAGERYNYYTALIDKGLSADEKAQNAQLVVAMGLTGIGIGVKGAAVVAYAIPTVFGFANGAFNPGGAISEEAAIEDAGAGLNSTASSISANKAMFGRRLEEWEFQKKTAEKDKQQLEHQILSAGYQKEAAKDEVKLLKKNIAQEQKVQQFLKNKFTNQQLYQWMSGKLAAQYFQCYQVANEMAIQAQQAWNFEKGEDQAYIKGAYWDGLYQGLLAGEALMTNLVQMENAFMKQNKRRLEIQKTISLNVLDAGKETLITELKTNKKCVFHFTESLFDADYPGQYCRQIVSLSVSFPTLIGPYQNIHAILTQTNNTTVLEPSLAAVAKILERKSDDKDLRKNVQVNQQIALSQGINDSGMFTLNFNDERYLPFEGTGAVSSWQLELFNDDMILKNLTDVIIQLNYTALQGDDIFRKGVEKLVKQKKG